MPMALTGAVFWKGRWLLDLAVFPMNWSAEGVRRKDALPDRRRTWSVSAPGRQQHASDKFVGPDFGFAGTG